jgi:FkbM family methyltransferase
MTATPEPAGLPSTVDFKWEGHGISLRFPSADDHVAKIVRHTKAFYEMEMLLDVRSRLFFAKCAVDVGAHVGNHSVFFALALGMRTLAFEPNPDSFALLEANIAANGLGDTCVLRKAGVGRHGGKARLVLDGTGKNSSAVKLEDDDDGDVEIVTLDESLRSEPQVDVIKIDVEGWESRVLQGASETIGRHRPILYVETLESNFAPVRLFLGAMRYVCWKRFNYTPTFLFLPEERLGVPPAAH